MYKLKSSNRDSPQNENFNLLVRIKSLNLFLYSSLKKLKYLLVSNKVLLVLVQRTGAHREECDATFFERMKIGANEIELLYLKRVLFTYKNRIPKVVKFCESRKTILLNNHLFIYRYSKLKTVVKSKD
jgi:hypothetical protein